MSSKKNLLRWGLPFLIFLLIIFFSWYGLHRDPRSIPSPLLNKFVPKFQAKTLQNPHELITEKNFIGHVTILNVFATWCIACHAEHSIWIEAWHDLQRTKIFGLNYKDEREKSQQWLKQYGNPYEKIIDDPNGIIGINFGVYGTPETFIIDSQGIIRFKYIGPVSPTIWNTILLPEVKKWEKITTS